MESAMILVVVGTLALMAAIFGWGVHSTRPRAVAADMRRADHAESLEPDVYLSDPSRRAFEASTWAH